MKRDAARYLPELMRLERVDSLFEVKTVLAQNENDDGRPILFQRHDELPGLFSVMGGKIDNVYDVIEKIREHV
jgi:8-oxo-dGTP pyrophosphatase MutT (NUDIX family)